MVVKIVNYIKMRPLKCRLFTKLCVSMETKDYTLIQHTDTMVVKRESVVLFLRTKRGAIGFLFARKPERVCRMLE